jgi:uncharacterized protein YukE
MSTGGVNVTTDVLRQAAGGLKGIGDELDQELKSLENELASLGDAWGDDDIGKLIGEAYKEVVHYAFDCLREVLHEILDSSKDLTDMANRYDEAERAISEGFNAFLQRLGSG